MSTTMGTNEPTSITLYPTNAAQSSGAGVASLSATLPSAVAFWALALVACGGTAHTQISVQRTAAVPVSVTTPQAATTTGSGSGAATRPRLPAAADPTKTSESTPTAVVLPQARETAISLSASPSERRVAIGNDGKLAGAANGYAWVAPSEFATIAFPNPCNSSGCFMNTGGQLCTKGSIAPLACSGEGTPQYRCNWDKNWGMVLGFNTQHPAAAWGNQAPNSLAVTYTSVAHAGSAGHFRLNAHVAGDPYSRQYCIDNYSPGAVIHPSDMKSECWFGTGDTLSSFKQVDTIGLLRVSENVPVAFDFCVTAITTD